MALASSLPMTWNSSPWLTLYPVFAITTSAKRCMTGAWCSITNCDRSHVRRPMPCRLCRWRACLSQRCRLSTHTLAMKACREREDYAGRPLYCPPVPTTYPTPPGNVILSGRCTCVEYGTALACFSQQPPGLGQSVWTHCRNSVYQASTWPSNRPRKQRLHHVRLASWTPTRLQPVDRRPLPCNKRSLSAFSPLSCQGASACHCSRRCSPLPASAIATTAPSAPDATSAV